MVSKYLGEHLRRYRVQKKLKPLNIKNIRNSIKIVQKLPFLTFAVLTQNFETKRIVN